MKRGDEPKVITPGKNSMIRCITISTNLTGDTGRGALRN